MAKTVRTGPRLKQTQEMKRTTLLPTNGMKKSGARPRTIPLVNMNVVLTEAKSLESNDEGTLQ